VLDGRHGFLDTYCRDADATRLTAGLMHAWETLRICLKAYPCHVTAHTPVQALRALMAQHRFDGDTIARLCITASAKVLSHHTGRVPADVMQAQYSVPFCVALAAFLDPADPRVWNDAAVADPRIGALCRRIELRPFAPDDTADSAWHTRLQVALDDGREFDADARHFRGMPEDPLDDDGVASKFRQLAGARGDPRVEALLGGLMALETAPDLGLLAWAAQL
jgi:2-methylcitrate dehydratase PrpD